jgi:hypothetical protein
MRAETDICPCFANYYRMPMRKGRPAFGGSSHDFYVGLLLGSLIVITVLYWLVATGSTRFLPDGLIANLLVLESRATLFPVPEIAFAFALGLAIWILERGNRDPATANNPS